MSNLDAIEVGIRNIFDGEGIVTANAIEELARAEVAGCKSTAQLAKLVRWIDSDDALRTEQELLDETARELGYQRKGGRIVDTLTRVIRTVRSQSGVKLTIENVVPEPRRWGDGACSVVVFFADGSKGEVATTLNAYEKHVDALNAIVGTEAAFDIEERGSYQGVKQRRILNYPGRPVGNPY